MIRLFFTSPVMSILAGAQDNKHGVRVRERVQVAGVPERIGALKSLVMLGSNTRAPEWQASALSIALCPSRSHQAS